MGSWFRRGIREKSGDCRGSGRRNESKKMRKRAEKLGKEVREIP